MHPALILAELKMRGLSQVAVAGQCGVTKSAVCHVIQGRWRSRKVENRIALALDRAPAELWPQWYGPNATRRRKHQTVVEKLTALEAIFMADVPP